jgi:exodeoxyribonuclease VIII
MSDYYQIKALSHSMLSCLAQNPMECKMRYVDDPPTLPKKDTAAFAMGHAVHCLALEPEKFDERFAVAPKVDRRTTAGKVAWAEYLADCEGKTVLDEQDHADAVACVQALNNHPEFATIMAQPRRVEVPFEFDLFGHRFKARLDCVIDSEEWIVDIKTTDDARPWKWNWSAQDLCYDNQAYIYREAIYQATGKRYRFFFAVVEKPKPSTRGIPPTAVVFEAEEDTMQSGETNTKKLVAEYSQRITDNDWTQSYSKDIEPLRLPGRRF